MTNTTTYDYMGLPHEIPASAEVPVDHVRSILREFVSTGERLRTTSWQ
ncbi:MAG: Imm1 family immunity protein [Haloechinothrix sp.]